MQFRWNGVSERDMDLLFLEEFALNEDFLNLFLQKTGNAELFSYKIVSEEVSLTDAVLGESDLTIVLEKDGRNVALLIENKIHKMKMRGVEYSYIDLTFNGLAAHREELKALLKDMLGERYAPQFGIHKTENSAVLRLIAPKYLDWQIPFEEQIDVVEDHLRLVALLCETAKQIDRERLIAFYAVAAPEKLK